MALFVEVADFEDVHHFDGHLFLCGFVESEVDAAEGALAQVL